MKKRVVIILGIMLFTVLLCIGIFFIITHQKIEYKEESVIPLYSEIIDQQVKKIQEQNKGMYTIFLEMDKIKDPYTGEALNETVKQQLISYCITKGIDTTKESSPTIADYTIVIALDNRKDGTATISITTTGNHYNMKETRPIKYEEGKWISNGLNTISNLGF